VHRQAANFEHAGHLIARSAFAHGVGECGVQLPPPVLHADTTPMAVLKSPHEHTPGTPVEPLHDRINPIKAIVSGFTHSGGSRMGRQALRSCPARHEVDPVAIDALHQWMRPRRPDRRRNGLTARLPSQRPQAARSDDPAGRHHSPADSLQRTATRAIMITVHHLETSRSQRVLWLLEELGLPYELKVYARDPKTRLAPAALKAVHPLGKSPVITDGGETIAESGAILEYLVDTYGQRAQGELARLQPERGSAEHRQCRFWMHHAEGSLMNWLVMKLVFMTIPTQPMPFFVRPIAKALCANVQAKLIDPNVSTALAFIEAHLKTHRWFAGEPITIADFQMSFAVEAALSRAANAGQYPALAAYRSRMLQRPAYQRAIAKGGPVVMS